MAVSLTRLHSLAAMPDSMHLCRRTAMTVMTAQRSATAIGVECVVAWDLSLFSSSCLLLAGTLSNQPSSDSCKMVLPAMWIYHQIMCTKVDFVPFPNKQEHHNQAHSTNPLAHLDDSIIVLHPRASRTRIPLAGGRHFIWLRHYFLAFPRNLCNLDFADGGFRNAIPARTGPDPDDKESGGQPVTLSVAFQYRLMKRAVPRVYQTFGMAWESSYMRRALPSTHPSPSPLNAPPPPRARTG